MNQEQKDNEKPTFRTTMADLALTVAALILLITAGVLLLQEKIDPPLFYLTLALSWVIHAWVYRHRHRFVSLTFLAVAVIYLLLALGIIR